MALASTLAAQTYADLILTNGKIWTGNTAQPQAEAVACAGGRIVAVGAAAEVAHWAGPRTRTIDLAGRRVVPGFNDAHVHFFDGGSALSGVQLRDASSQAEFRERIRAFAATLPPGRWILDGDWDHERWTPAQLPTRQLIDESAGDHPVFVNRLDGHMSLANSLALKLAGITRNMPDPPGGTIVRDAAGEPTGVLKDAAMAAVNRVIPAPSQDQILDALRAAMRYAAENGVTSVQDMSAAPAILRAYQRLLAAGELNVRVSGHQPLADWQRLANVGVLAGFGGPMLHIGGLKGFADGSLGSTTALLFEPYLDAPNTSGLANEEMIPETKMRAPHPGRGPRRPADLRPRHRRQSQSPDPQYVRGRRSGQRPARPALPHRARAAPAGRPTSRASPRSTSSPPCSRIICIDDGRWAEKRIGPERAKTTYAFRSLLDSGAVLAFGSDWDVAPMDALMGIYAAATRRTLDGKRPGGWVPEQKITVAEAVRAYTLGSAYASFEERIKGTIEPGKLADMAVLSADIFAIDPVEIQNAKVTLTVFDGRIVYQR